SRSRKRRLNLTLSLSLSLPHLTCMFAENFSMLFFLSKKSNHSMLFSHWFLRVCNNVWLLSRHITHNGEPEAKVHALASSSSSSTFLIGSEEDGDTSIHK